MEFKGKLKEPNRAIEHVYYSKEEKFIASIEHGVFETEDEQVIEWMKELGYEVLEDSVIGVELPQEEANETVGETISDVEKKKRGRTKK